MRTKFSGILTLLLAFVVQLSFAQVKTITGTVTDDTGLPLPGVNIIIKNTNTGTQSDFDGNYSINASQGQTLVFSYVGFTSVERPVTAANTINVQMQPDAAVLDEIVITGYTRGSRALSTIAASTVSAQTIENRPNVNVLQTLQGQVPGLNILAGSGQPGVAPIINIRGINSIGGRTTPLFIIDGVPVESTAFRSLNPQEIESINVLKDAAGTAIYGSRGANGVIVIETRRGTFDTDLAITYTGMTGYTTLQGNDYGLMDAPQQLRLEKQLGRGRGATLTDEEIDNYETFDWVDFFFKTGLSQSHTVNLSSGSANATQFTSIGFNDTEGILINTNLKRFNLRNNVAGRSSNGRFNYNTNVSANYSSSNDINSLLGTGGVNRNYVLGAFQSVPYVHINEYPGSGAALVAQGTNFVRTPLFLYDQSLNFTRFDEEFRMVTNLGADYKLTDELTAGVSLSSDYRSLTFNQTESPLGFNAILFAEPGNNTPGFQDQRSRREFSFNQVTSLTYNKQIEDHTFTVSAFTEYFKAHLRQFGFRQNGLDPLTFAPQDGGGFISYDPDNPDYFYDEADALKRDAGLFSYFGVLDYDYNARYGLNASVRRDASYRFSGSNKWATFYAVGARWNISNEDFMEGSVFDMLKLRASYGETGNQYITSGTYWASPNLYETLFLGNTGYGGQQALLFGQIGNTDLRWETVAQANIGIDFELFDRRLSGVLDVYEKKTTDLFQEAPLSGITGQFDLDRNIGSMYNRGVDLELNYHVIRSLDDGFNLSLNVVGNYNQNELADLPSEDGEIVGIGRNGGPLGEYYQIRYSRVNPENGNLLFFDADGNETETPDADADRVWTGKNIFPDYTGGFGVNMDYKGFFLETQFNYVIGVDRFDGELFSYTNPNNIGQFRSTTDLLRAWTPDNTNTDIPSLTATNLVHNTNIPSDYFIRDASFLRLRFISFGYNFSPQLLQGTGITGLRTFINGENLLTFTNWRGFDPELATNTSRSYPTPKIVSVGAEIKF